jgi:nucleoside 2-deoxyribosyltransferase
MRVYLGGPISGCTDEEVHGWREQVKPIFESVGFICLDPSERDYRGKRLTRNIAVDIVEHDTRDIRNCDLAFFNCWKQDSPMWGTAMEIRYAWSQEKINIIVLPEIIEPSPWLLYHGHIYPGEPEQVARWLIRNEGFN